MFNSVDGFPAHERGEQPGQAEDVVQVAVGDENVAQVPEADAGLQDLALGALRRSRSGSGIRHA